MQPLLAVIGVLLLVIYWFKRRVRDVQSACFFCHHLQTIPKDDVNSWTCRNCQQYNGFLETGDYNQDNPAFYKETLNKAYYCERRTIKQADNGLCSKCNEHQQIQVKVLAEFEPFKAEHYDQELALYRRRLEQLYPLCLQCKALVSRVLAQQQLSLKQKTKEITKKIADLSLDIGDAPDKTATDGVPESPTTDRKPKSERSILGRLLQIFTPRLPFRQRG